MWPFSRIKQNLNQLLDAAENPSETLAYAENRIKQINQEIVDLFETWDRCIPIMSERAQDTLRAPFVAAEIAMWRAKKRTLLSRIRLELDKHLVDSAENKIDPVDQLNRFLDHEFPELKEPLPCAEDQIGKGNQDSEVLARIHQAYSLMQKNRSPEGFPRDITRSGRVAAILAAHAAYPTSHKNAQGYAQMLVDDLEINTVLKGYAPCIVLGIQAAHTYLVLEGRINKIFGPFRPACIVHNEHYDRCHPECEYGVKLKDKWVHEILDAQP